MFVGACGKRKPPLPPVERVPQRPALTGYQRGGRVILNWNLGPRNATEGDLLNISRVDVYRLAEPLNSLAGVSEEDFASRSTLVAAVTPKPEDFKRRSMSYADDLSFAGQAARLRYAVRFVNSSGQKAGFSDFLVIDPTARVALAPSATRATLGQDAITLSWRRPDANVDGSTPANIIGFNVYRTSPGVGQKLVNQTPVTSDEFRDRGFEFTREYEYVVRTVSLGANGEPIESADSPSAAVKAVDTFAPSAPSALTIAAAPNAVSLFFATNLEPDVAGYTIYRSTDKSRPRAEWQRLTPQLLATNTFVDSAVESGRTYYYYVTATDRFGNVSEGSEIVGDTVP